MTCDNVRDELLARVAARDTAPASPELARHLALCVECAARDRRLFALARQLADWTRQGAPAQLEGRVVAAMHAGHRQDRVLAQLESLPRRSAPAQLTDPAANPLHRRAPAELDARVEHDCADPSATVVSQVTQKLARLSAPPELDQRIESMLALGLPRSPRPPQRAARALGVALSLGLVSWIGLRAWLPTEPVDASPYRFEVRRISDPSEARLDAGDLAFLEGVTGPFARSR